MTVMKASVFASEHRYPWRSLHRGRCSRGCPLPPGWSSPHRIAGDLGGRLLGWAYGRSRRIRRASRPLSNPVHHGERSPPSPYGTVRRGPKTVHGSDRSPEIHTCLERRSGTSELGRVRIPVPPGPPLRHAPNRAAPGRAIAARPGSIGRPMTLPRWTWAGQVANPGRVRSVRWMRVENKSRGQRSSRGRIRPWTACRSTGPWV